MEIDAVDNLTASQILELYNDVVEGPEHLAVSPWGFYTYDDTEGHWICERLGVYCRESDQARLYMDQCYNFSTGQTKMVDTPVGAYGCWDTTK